jgi:hypothetical protein
VSRYRAPRHVAYLARLMPARDPSLPTARERQALQLLLSGDWTSVRTIYSPKSRTLVRMIDKGWIERKPLGMYRITDAGRMAFRSKIG